MDDKSIIIILGLTLILCLVLIPFLIKTIIKIIDLIKHGESPSIGMYYDAELGSINGEVDNRGKFICESCEKRFKTEKQLIVHLRKHKINKLKST